MRNIKNTILTIFKNISLLESHLKKYFDLVTSCMAELSWVLSYKVRNTPDFFNNYILYDAMGVTSYEKGSRGAFVVVYGVVEIFKLFLIVIQFLIFWD